MTSDIQGGVLKLVAGTNITLSPATGVGVVTVNATGGGLAATLFNNSKAPTGTSADTQVMMGLALAFTPLSTGLVRFTFVANLKQTSSATNDVATVTMQYGTGIAPGNGAGQTGTQFDAGIRADASSTAYTNPVISEFAVVQLVAGTTYWFDLSLSAGAGILLTLTQLSLMLEELAQ